MATRSPSSHCLPFTLHSNSSTFCFTSTEARWLIRDRDREERGGKSEGLTVDTAQKKTRETVDCCQNNGSVKAVSPRHCPATSALHNCCFNCSVGQSHKDNVRCTAAEERLKAKEVQLSQPHLPPLDLTWYLDSNSSTSIIFSVIVLSSKRGVTHTTGSLLGPLCANTFLHQVSSQ